MKRRTWLYAGVGVVAAVAGAGWAVRRRDEPAAGDAIWNRTFPRPDGSAGLRLATLRGAPLLVNFWATWCPPCVTELPLLDRFWNRQRAHGWQVIGLAVDQAEPVQTFLRTRAVGFPVVLAGMEGVELSRQLGNGSGALPFSVVFDSSGAVAARKLGVLAQADLDGWSASIR
ncbi:MAG: TlpA family protein disulfide reductase [Proteobacteria bacterium]|nr:TlpA family protein disulfide reductase [Pseudomonadota bacterium]